MAGASIANYWTSMEVQSGSMTSTVVAVLPTDTFGSLFQLVNVNYILVL